MPEKPLAANSEKSSEVRKSNQVVQSWDEQCSWLGIGIPQARTKGNGPSLNVAPEAKYV